MRETPAIKGLRVRPGFQGQPDSQARMAIRFSNTTRTRLKTPTHDSGSSGAACEWRLDYFKRLYWYGRDARSSNMIQTRRKI